MNTHLSLKIIRQIQKQPAQSQRGLSGQCGVSLGSIHCCLKELIKKGYIKAKNFKNAKNKVAYSYILTASGITLKKKLTMKFLQRKQEEYGILQQEIKELEEDLAQ